LKLLMEEADICNIVDYYCLTRIATPTNDNFLAS
jgi:hypothetical protein